MFFKSIHFQKRLQFSCYTPDNAFQQGIFDKKMMSGNGGHFGCGRDGWVGQDHEIGQVLRDGRKVCDNLSAFP
jgi:hypothetical protein